MSKNWWFVLVNSTRHVWLWSFNQNVQSSLPLTSSTVICPWVMLFFQSISCRRPHTRVIYIDRDVTVFICTFTALLLRTVTWPSVHGADQTHHAPHWCARPGSAVRSPLVWPRQGRSGLGRERQGRILHLRLRGGGQVPAQAWPGSDLSCSSGKWPLSSGQRWDCEMWLYVCSPLDMQTHSIQVVQVITHCAENWYTLRTWDSVSQPFGGLTLQNKEMSTSHFWALFLCWNSSSFNQ